ncbi:MAG TPA: transporter [Candidatus Rokubacteria bacterium]|nr:MAG: transporter [Candidatus Rokubacteria bacterium GWA2_70_23]OGK89202.1 MAG: transporter [Candidatus Rokubacteria bacterium GWF2_70_14]HAM57713.1 transporter [Candidatus Rokubacteria bacterium]
MDTLSAILAGFAVALEPAHILYCVVGVVVGTVVGVLPGLGPAATIALLLPVTYRLEPVSAVIMLAGIYYGSQYGGSTTSILVRIPGESSSMVTCYDGYEMTRRGRAGAALGMAAIASFVAGTASVIGLMLVAPLLGRFALAFGPWEYASLMVLGLTLVAYLGGASLLRALAMAVVGLLLATVGQDPVAGVERFTFGAQTLLDGIDLVPVFMGLFGIAEVLETMERPPDQQRLATPGDLLPTRQDFRDSLAPVARGTVLGFFLGVLPGGGATVASIASYVTEKRFARNRDRLGQGAIEGVAGPEAANNAAATGSFVPLLTLGIPANVVMAMMLAALTLHGIRPGPLLISERPDLFWGTITSMYLGNVLLLILNLPLVGLFIQILRVPYPILAPAIVLFCLIGAYSVTGQVAEVLTMVCFGIGGYLLRKLGFEAAPLVLALILGRPLEEALRQALALSQGSFLPFLTRPISLVLLLATAAALTTPLARAALARPPR